MKLSETIWNNYSSQYMTRTDLIDFIETIRVKSIQLETTNASLETQNEKLVQSAERLQEKNKSLEYENDVIDSAIGIVVGTNESLEEIIEALKSELKEANELVSDPDNALEVLGGRI